MTILNRYVKGKYPSDNLLQDKNRACLRALERMRAQEAVLPESVPAKGTPVREQAP